MWHQLRGKVHVSGKMVTNMYFHSNKDYVGIVSGFVPMCTVI